MLDTHVVQQLSPLGTARGGEDLASGGPCDRDRRLPDTTGPRVNQHLVVRADASQIVQGTADVVRMTEGDASASTALTRSS